MPFYHLEDPAVQLRTSAHKNVTRSETFDEFNEVKPAADSVVERRAAMFRKLWLTGHTLIMPLSILSIFFCLTRQIHHTIPRLVYRTTFLVIVLTYGISLLQNLNGSSPGFYALLPLDTFQYIILASLWVFTTPHTIKLLSFALFSTLHVADAYGSKRPEASGKRVAKLSDELATKVINSIGYLDMWLLVELLIDCLLIRPGAVVSLVVFGVFFRIKLMYSPVTKDAFLDVYHYVDKALIDDRMPKSVREMWVRFRSRLDVESAETSKIYHEDTDKAIEMANIYNSLD